MSGASAYEIYNKQFEKGLITGGYQAQKFNFNVINGLAKETAVIALSSMYYGNFDVPGIDEIHDGIRYITIRNYSGLKHKFLHVKELIKKGKQIITENKPKFIICDAISLPHSIAAKYLSKKFKIPSVAIVTDVPEVYCSGKMGLSSKLSAYLMKRYSMYVLLTDDMKNIVNPKDRPYVVMEGSCDINQCGADKNKRKPYVCLYGGSLWENAAGIEYLVEGFLNAEIPDCELHFYGTGVLENWLKEIEKEHPNIKYKGCVRNEELIELESKATLLINPRPSDSEFCKYSFPSKTFEYMASGTPVLMTKLPGIPEEYFEYVYTINNETAAGICEELKKIFLLSQEDRNIKGEKARLFVMNNKNNIVQAKKMIDFLYESINNYTGQLHR